MAENKGACTRFQNRMFQFILLVFTITMYYTLIFQQHMLKLDEKSPAVQHIFVGITHLFQLMTLWCYFTTYFMDPGKPPIFWGFYLDDPEQKRRRYCLICHIFKPERCHHCSACNRCVLNMDHHCPWLNTCIGYYNRKFFMQLLLYAWLLGQTMIVGNVPHLIFVGKEIINMQKITVQFLSLIYSGKTQIKPS